MVEYTTLGGGGGGLSASSYLAAPHSARYAGSPTPCAPGRARRTHRCEQRGNKWSTFSPKLSTHSDKGRPPNTLHTKDTRRCCDPTGLRTTTSHGTHGRPSGEVPS